jgi:hypothetical protein
VLNSTPIDSEGEYNETLSYCRYTPFPVVYILAQVPLQFPICRIVFLSYLKPLPYVIAAARPQINFTFSLLECMKSVAKLEGISEELRFVPLTTSKCTQIISRDQSFH